MNRETEVEVEDEQTFLERQLTLMQQASNVKDARLSPINISKGGTPDSKRSSLGLPSSLGNTPRGQMVSSQLISGMSHPKLNIIYNVPILIFTRIFSMTQGDSQSSERVLANFFNSLLNKKTGGSPSAPNSLNGNSNSDIFS